jgi:hypothetical protein
LELFAILETLEDVVARNLAYGTTIDCIVEGQRSLLKAGSIKALRELSLKLLEDLGYKLSIFVRELSKIEGNLSK